MLGERRYLLGDALTEADWRLFTTLVRFDAVYHGHFKCNLRRLVDYPNLWGYTRDLYQLPGVAATVELDQIKRHYYCTHASINPTRIVPARARDRLRTARPGLTEFGRAHGRGSVHAPIPGPACGSERPAQPSLERAQMLIAPSTACRSISASSSRGEVEPLERGDVLLELRDAARADQRRA